MRKIIRSNGTEVELLHPQTTGQIAFLLGAGALTTVTLHHLHPLHVMLLNDLGHDLGLPFNGKASQLYWKQCKPGTTHPILGDVAIVPDSDFIRDDDDGPQAA